MQCYHYNKIVTRQKWALYTFRYIMGEFANVRGIPESMHSANTRSMRRTHESEYAKTSLFCVV